MSKLVLAIVGAVLPLLVSPAPAAEPPRKPNLILILADDLGYETLGCNGGTSYATPNLDALAGGGVRFTRCYAQPLCTPTRVQLMTGQYNVRNYTRFGQIEPGQTTFAQLLKSAGYATGIAGKWQLGQDPSLPKQLGFDEAYLWQHTRRPPRYANPGLEVNGKEVDFASGAYGPELINRFALDFVARHKGEPFCLYYPMIEPHNPFQPTPDSPEWDPKAVGEQVNQRPKHFGDMVTYMDKMVGRLVAKLDELGLREHTLILFVGDNGTNPSITSQTTAGPVRGGKGQSTAAGTHVPLVASWPGRIAKGKVCDDLVDTTDFLPTLLAAAGVAPPTGDRPVDGRSFWPQLIGEPGNPRAWVYSWYAREGGPKADREFAAGRRFKLYRSGELYDVKKDVLESTPLPADGADAEARAARGELQKALDGFAGPRPEAIVRQAGPPRKGRNAAEKE